MVLVTIPEDIRKQLRKKTFKQKSVRMVRSLVFYSPFKEGDVSYGYFKYVRENGTREFKWRRNSE